MTTQTKTDKAEESPPYFLMLMAMIVPVVLMAMLKSVLAPAENLKDQNLPAVDNSSNSVPSWAYDGRPLCLENKVYVLSKTRCLTDGTRTGIHGVEPCLANSGFRIRPVFADGKHEQCTTQISAPEIAVFKLQSELDNVPIVPALEQKMAEKLEEKNLHVRR
jgi:hypothetical protein